MGTWEDVTIHWFTLCSLDTSNEINTLNAEKDELLKDLRLSDSQTNQSRDEGNIQKLTQLLAERGQLMIPASLTL